MAYKDKDDLTLFLKKSIDILVSETHFTHKSHFNIPGYKLFHKLSGRLHIVL